eukprot:PhM_4_TR8447/c0_g1_i1/m.51369/K02324/POLE1; DNA polymerase epsilon subunit 1
MSSFGKNQQGDREKDPPWVRSLQQEERVGWLVNFRSSSILDQESKVQIAALQMYFLESDGETFTCKLPYSPYFYVVTIEGCEREVEMGIKHNFASTVVDVEWCEKEDLAQPNHLSGRGKIFLKVSFNNVQELIEAKSKINTALKRNLERDAFHTEFEVGQQTPNAQDGSTWMDKIVDMREYDVKYHMRCSIDLDIFVGVWYKVAVHHGTTTVVRAEDAVAPNPRIFVFDIETTKAPLKFPQPGTDQVFMISAMCDDRGLLMINREVVADDIENFEYIPKHGHSPVDTVVTNLPNEKELLKYFFKVCREFKPHVVVTYNGDVFDFPFMSARAELYGMNMKQEIGFEQNAGEGSVLHHLISHLDCIYWVKRDSYLPQGSHGLKAVTRAKLGYNPVEVDPEDMVPLARTQPQRMASYSVSDAVSTYHLFQKYVQPFIFSLCTIIPLSPDEVLRKGSGTLCESLLCIQAFRLNVIYPNKMVEVKERFHEGHLLDSETYIGGHVEALQAGVFRHDIPIKFDVHSQSYQQLIDNLDAALTFALEVESNVKVADVENYDEVKADIAAQLAAIRDEPSRTECPMIIHLDVGAMYPNIILTNRLQPPSMVTEDVCAACCYNRPENECQRRMNWIWKGEMFTLNRHEFNRIKTQLELEAFKPEVIEKAQAANENKKSFKFKRPLIETNNKGGGKGKWNKKGDRGGGRGKPSSMQDEFKRSAARVADDDAEKSGSDSEDDQQRFHDLDGNTQFGMVKRRVVDYCKKAYRKVHATKDETRTAIVCQRENSFYVDTVRLFRDRRYVYKAETKKWKGLLNKALEAGASANPSIKECQSRCVQYESLQLAHKCILNSFYGYVMRKGSRWYSMEMAGVVTHLGATLIMMARELIENLGVPLELDTDGIWCCLPGSFPSEFTFKTKAGKKVGVNYPCLMLNCDTNEKYTNHQYQVMKSPGVYETKPECSIFFELDGPHNAMILPASREEGGCIKKRYAVFYADGSLGELKGFEIKRRGELKMLKDFQNQVFGKFMEGKTLSEAYEAAASVANNSLDLLYSKGQFVDDDEILDVLTESRNMSRRLDEYPKEQKSLALTTARRLAEFLGPQMVQDRGLNCSFLISRKPEGKPVTERAVPITIFNTDDETRDSYLRKWTGDTAGRVSLREMLDWDYYITRFSSCVQKIITIPAALQGIVNPVPRVKHPEWLARRVRVMDSKLKQTKLPIAMMKERGAMIDDDDDANTFSTPLSRNLTTIVVAPPVKFNRDNFSKATFADREMDDEFYRHGDFKQWMSSMQGKWRTRARVNREASKSLGGPSTLGHAAQQPETLPTDLRSFAQRMQRKVLTAVWHVVEVRPINESNVQLLALLDGTTMHTFTVHVPRTLYINSTTQLETNAACSSVNGLVLPRKAAVHNLYALQVNDGSLSSIVASLQSCTDSVKGVYESQLDLVTRMMLQVGNRLRVKPTAVKERGQLNKSNDIFTLAELQSVDTMPYLENARLQYVYIYHAFVEGRGIMCVVHVERREATVLVVQPATAAKPKLSIDILSEDAIHSQLTQASQWSPPAALTSEVYTEQRQAWSKLDELLAQYLSEGAMVALVQSQSGRDILSSGAVATLEAVPCLFIPFNRADEKMFTVNPLYWARDVTRRSLHRFLTVEPFVTDRLGQAVYGDVPLCNLTADSYAHLWDLLFSRHLKQHGHVLWHSTTDRPDLGRAGYELSQHLLEEWDEPWSAKEVVHAGFHFTWCAELRLAHLEVASILFSQMLMDAEDPTGVSFESTGLVTHFHILRQLVGEIYADAVQHKKDVADSMLVHMCRWLRSKMSALYEPLLARLVNNVANRALSMILIKISKIGAKIVIGRRDRILIATPKISFKDATGFVSYIMTSLRREDFKVMQHVSLNITNMWAQYLVVDTFNYIGRKVEGMRTGPTVVDDFVELDDVGEPSHQKVEFQWAMTEFVPDRQQRSFLVHMTQIIVNVAEYKHTALAAVANDTTMTFASKYDKIRGSVTARLRDFVESDFQPRFLRELHNLTGAGSDLAIRMCRTMCQVLRCIDGIAQSVEQVHHNACTVVRISPFAPAPSMTSSQGTPVVIRDFMCPFCNDVQDFDIRRRVSSGSFTCTHCHHPFNEEALELYLVDTLDTLIRRYLVQDLKCEKCRQCRDTQTAKVCTSCSGRFTYTLSPEDVRGYAHSLKDIAVARSYTWLLESADAVMI